MDLQGPSATLDPHWPLASIHANGGYCPMVCLKNAICAAFAASLAVFPATQKLLSN
jgi:hypothetical protein